MAFGILFSLLYISDSLPHRPRTVTVIIPENGSAPEGPHYVPSIIKVVIGVNNTVRWINHDSIPNSVVADNDSDPEFDNAAGLKCENNDFQNCAIISGTN